MRLTCAVVFSSTGEVKQDDQQGESCSDPMDSLYRDVFVKGGQQQASLQDSERDTSGAPHLLTHATVSDQSQDSQRDNNQSEAASGQQGERSSLSESSSNPSEQQLVQEGPRKSPPAAPTQINISQPIGSLCGAAKAGSGRQLTVRGDIETISDEEILNNRESEDGIRSIPRFRNYEPGKPNKVKTPWVWHHRRRASDEELILKHGLFLSAGVVCEEPESTGLSGPAGGAVLQVRAGERTAGRLPPADRTDEGSGLHHAARWETMTWSSGSEPQ